jgi:alpha-1,2-mannosyltransferase
MAERPFHIGSTAAPAVQDGVSDEGVVSSFDHRRPLILMVAAVLTAVVLWAGYRSRPDTATIQIVQHALTSAAGTDSTFYMQMGLDAFRAPGHAIYRQLFFVQHLKYIYPPSSLFVMEAMDRAARDGWPLSTVMRWSMVLLWMGTLFCAAWMMVRSGRFGSRRQRWWMTFCAVVLTVLFLPVAEAFYRGQAQLLLTLLWGVAVLYWMGGRPAWSALALALSCVFKPQMAVFLVWGVARRQWRFTLVLLAALTAIEACAVVHFGVRNNLDYIAVLRDLSRHGEALWANQSVNGLMNRLLRNGNGGDWSPTVYPPYRAAVFVVSTVFAGLLLLAALVVPWRRGWQATTADLLLFGSAATLASPIVWEHHYGVFLFLLLYLLMHCGEMRRWQWWTFVASVLAMSNRLPPLDHHVQGLATLVGGYLFYAGLTMLLLLVLLAEGKQRRLSVV